MGVTGLWRLIEPAGKPVPVETLENKVLAVDISIWLHQMVKGYQDTKGAPLPNAHLIGLFQRLCKLLYFRIKPVFVFDGGFPELKKETIGKRQDNKAKYNSESERLKREIAVLLGKKTAIGSLLGKQIPPKRTNTFENNDDMFKLPALPEKDQESESESEDERSTSSSSIDLHTVDLESDNFKSLPAKEKYDLLVELKETRKMNSWGKLHILPKKSDNFSDFQMQRLLKRRKLQECIEETEKEIGEGSMSLNELESLLNEEGIDTKIESIPSRRIASNETTRYVLIRSVRQALAEAKKREESKTTQQAIENTGEEINVDAKQASTTHDELEDDLQKAIKMSLECVDEHDSSACTSKTDDSWTSNLSDSDYSDSEEEDGFVQSDMSSAKAYIMQYSDFTSETIDDIIISKQNTKKKSKSLRVDKILEELNKEKSIIDEKMEISSSEEDFSKNKSSEASLSSNLSISSQVMKKNETNDMSIICVKENNEIILLDESTENILRENRPLNLSEQKFEQVTEIKDKLCKGMENFEPTDINTNKDITKVPVISSENEEKVIRVDTSIEEKGNLTSTDNQSNSNEDDFEIKDKLCKNMEIFETTDINTNKDITKLPVVSSENEEKVIRLNTSIEEKGNQTNTDNQSDSSEDDFEEVYETDGKFKTPVVQLTLNLDEKLQDDIFADVFDENLKKEITNVEKETITSKININSKESLPATSERDHFNENVCVSPPFQTNISIQSQEVSNETNTDKEPQQITNIKESRDKELNNSTLKDKLNSMVSEIEDKEDNLIQEKARLDRVGRNITEQMTKEAQELLQIFGIPYIVAPMEAEAQCAFLESVKLTDGTITDDSDIWLFGGQTVYKNFFNQKKHVLQYLNQRIEKSFNLTREQLVLLALLVGSDYTPGVTGVGPVTALEILASFPINKKKLLVEQSKQARYQEIINGLIEFKKWVKAGKRTDNISLKKKLKNVNLTDDFPSIRVVQAYLEPNVERSEEKFTWGNLDITILRDYTKAKFGWSQNKLDEIVKPVLKRMQDRKNQKTVHDYFNRKVDFQSLEDQMSKRVKAAVHKMGPHESVSNSEDNTNKKIRKRKLPTSKTTSKDEVSGNSKDMAPSAAKQIKELDNIDTITQVLKTQEVLDKAQKFDINISKTQQLQEIIPQREKDKQNMLQNKLKAIETFRKTKIDRKKRTTKRKLPKPKEDAGLSESSDSN